MNADQKQAFDVALGAVTDFYNGVVADLRKRLADVERERDQWYARYQRRHVPAAAVPTEEPQGTTP